MRVLAWAVLSLLTFLPVAATHAPCPPEDCPVLQPLPQVPYLQGPVDLQSFQATVRVTDGIAVTALELHLQAETTGEATLSIPMPGGSSLIGFNLTVGDRVLEGRVTEKAQAAQEYQEAKEAGRDAALLQHAGDRLVRLSVNVPAGEVRILKASYVEIVPLAAGERVYRLPVSQVGAAKEVAFDFVTEVPLAGLRFPALPMTVVGPTATFRAEGVSDDLVAVWSEGGEGWRASLATSHAPGAEAAWVAQVCLRSPHVLARDVVFVLDKSGSMSGSKMVEARESLRAALAALAPGDHYDIVTFDSHVDAYHGTLMPRQAATVADDRARLAVVGAGGGTDIDGGLQEALRILAASPDSPRLPMVVFLTDGLPSAGVVDHDLIIERFRATNTRMATVQVVPIGLDADHTFLADLALRSGGIFLPVDPADGDVAGRLGRIYDVVGQALLRDVTVSVEGIEGLDPTNILPDPLPLLYEDGCLVLGLHGTAASGTLIRLSIQGTPALGGDGQAEFLFAVDETPVEPAVERLWARMRIDQLLSTERMEGSTDVLRATIVEEAVRLRQLTPYTSWIITDEAPVSRVEFNEASPGSAGGSMVALRASTTGTAPPSTGGVMDSYQFDAGAAGPPVGRKENGADTTTAQTPGIAVPLLIGLVFLVAWRRR